MPDILTRFVKPCTVDLISNCSKHWQDVSVAEKCAAYMAKIMSKEDLDQFIWYRNPHCAVCNFKKIEYRKCQKSKAFSSSIKPMGGKKSFAPDVKKAFLNLGINCWEQWTREGTHVRKTGSGATRKTTRREDRTIVRQALVDLTVTRSTIRADAFVAIVPQTISRHLAKANLKSKHPFRALPLTPEHRQLRLQWCQVRSMWKVTDWQKVVFSDESRFVLGTDDKRVRVWRRPVSGTIPPHTILRHTARTAGVMVWGGHSL
ncbi:transposable element Tc1 transposase [Trichonephila clavipes]|nr:transposable element Tc1 transposase [Trichonephila clavipes]